MIPNTSVFDITKIAAAAHEMNRIYCAAIGDSSQPHWEEAPDNIKQSAIDGVQAIIDGVVTKPGDSHVNWLKFKEADGWVYGEKKDLVAKTHPCMVPFEQLPKEQQLKDNLFFGLVSAMLEFNEHVLEPPTAESPAEEPGPGEEFIAKQSLKLIGFLYQHYDEEFQGELGFGDIAINVITKLRGKLAGESESRPAEGMNAYDLDKGVMTVEEAKAHFEKEAGEAAVAYTEMKKIEATNPAQEAAADISEVTGMGVGAPEVGGHDTIETPADVPQSYPTDVTAPGPSQFAGLAGDNAQEPNTSGVPVNVADGQ